MKGLLLTSTGKYPEFHESIKYTGKEGQSRIDIKASALNHRDVWITKGKYPGIQLPVVLGSDGAGVVGERKVIINPNINWGYYESHQDDDYQILGMPSYGTFAEYAYVGEDRLHDMPAHLTFVEAAALPLNGLTAYRAVFTKGKVASDSTVLIHGIGGGVALMAMQFCLAVGAKVFVTSSSEEKIAKAKKLGAQDGVLYTTQDWEMALGGLSSGIDVVIDGAGGLGVSELLMVCNSGARYVIYGGTKGRMDRISPQVLFWKQMQIMGTTMGSDHEFVKMLDFVNQYKIKPVIDSVYPLSEGHKGFEKMDKGLQFGKIVFSNG